MSDPEKNDSHEGQEQSEPKIIVDDDWKDQVAREKAQALDKQAEPPSVDPDSAPSDPAEAAAPDAEAVNAGAADADDVAEGEPLPPPPPASFDVLVSMLFTQAMAMLGQIPQPDSGKLEINKPYAKHYIDTLEMLGQKTEGNRSDDESTMLSEALHALRMTYVNVRATPPTGGESK